MINRELNSSLFGDCYGGSFNRAPGTGHFPPKMTGHTGHRAPGTGQLHSPDAEHHSSFPSKLGNVSVLMETSVQDADV